MKGITWCDFLGIFIMVIDHEGELRVLAINVNEFNESQEFYTIISSFQICKPNTFICNRRLIQHTNKKNQSSMLKDYIIVMA